MNVILKETLENLGEIGTVVNVANGYARNYLIPRGFAVEATRENIAHVEKIAKKIREKTMKEKETALEVQKEIENLTFTIARKSGEGDKLFGSVTNQDISDLLSEKGFEIGKKKVDLSAPIKALGIHSVPVNLHPEVKAMLKIEVVKE